MKPPRFFDLWVSSPVVRHACFWAQDHADSPSRFELVRAIGLVLPEVPTYTQNVDFIRSLERRSGTHAIRKSDSWLQRAIVHPPMLRETFLTPFFIFRNH